MSTGIEWTDETWNPVTGCDQVSPGCGNCYALTLAKRLKAMGNPRYQVDGRDETSGPGFGLTLHHDKLEQPLRWRKPRRVFVNSMSDLFHPDVPDGFIGSVWRTMALTPQHTYQILTKRPKRMRALLRQWQGDGAWRDHRGLWNEGRSWPLANVWLGVSVEDQERALARVPDLLDTPAAVRFLSCEPLLGRVDLQWWLGVEWMDILDGYGHEMFASLQGRVGPDNGLHWVIVGGESGHGARPMDIAWARTIVQQCLAAQVPVFVKQLGSRFGADHHEPGAWPEDLRVREWPDREEVAA